MDQSMASTWSSGMTFQPPYINEQKQDSLNDDEFTFKDFEPQCQEPGGLFKTAVFENFRILIDRANDWLRANRKWKVTTCESVEFVPNRGQIDSSKMCFIEYEHIIRYVRGLRLWLTKRKNDNEPEQQIGYVNLIPQTIEEGGIFKAATYETLDELIKRFNTTIQSNPLPGRVITIESQEMDLSFSRDVDPDRSYWVEIRRHRKSYLFVIRVFYEVMTGDPEEIGVADFVPNMVSSGGIISLPEYEPFSGVVQKASNWFSQQRYLRFCNAQSVEIKLTSRTSIDTNRMDYYESENMGTFYVRILRVAYTKSLSYTNIERPTIDNGLTCKTFAPVQISSSWILPDYENLNGTKRRVSDWIKATGARVLSAETSAFRLTTGTEAKLGTEASSTYNRGNRRKFWIFIFRLYLDGAYNEPPQDMLPPLPECKNVGCCVII